LKNLFKIGLFFHDFVIKMRYSVVRKIRKAAGPRWLSPPVSVT
jgi:hypothetical protein